MDAAFIAAKGVTHSSELLGGVQRAIRRRDKGDEVVGLSCGVAARVRGGNTAAQAVELFF